MADKSEERGILEIAGISWQVDAVAFCTKRRVLLPLAQPLLYEASSGSTFMEMRKHLRLVSLPDEIIWGYNLSDLATIVGAVVATDNSHPFVGIDTFCSCCGRKLDNLGTGIVIVGKEHSQRTICGVCVPSVKVYGWEELVRAKAL